MSTSGPRGHNSLLGAIDTAMAVEMTSTAIRIKSIKQRDLPIQEQEFRVKLVLADQSGGETCAVEFVGATLEDAQHYGDEGRRLSCDPEVLAFFTKHLSAGPQKQAVNEASSSVPSQLTAGQAFEDSQPDALGDGQFIDAAYSLGPDKPYQALNALSDSATLADPSKLLDIYGQIMQYSNSLTAGMSPKQTALFIGENYSQVFANDPTAIWFGLAPYAVAKVGQSYTDFSSLEMATTLLPGATMANLNAQTEIAESGFYAGNRAIFQSMNSAEMVYQAGGTAAVQQMVDDGATFGANVAETSGLDALKNLVQSFQLRDQAQIDFAAGNSDDGNLALAASLKASATFEQIGVLQQYYDEPRTVTEGGITYTNTLRGAISSIGQTISTYADPLQIIFYSLGLSKLSYMLDPNSATTTMIMGQSVTFNGTDIGNPVQRMPFVLQLGNDLMNSYSVSANGLTGAQRIFQEQQQLLQTTFGITNTIPPNMVGEMKS